MRRPIAYRWNDAHQMVPIYGIGPWWAHVAMEVLETVGTRSLTMAMTIERRWIQRERREVTDDRTAG